MTNQHQPPSSLTPLASRLSQNLPSDHSFFLLALRSLPTVPGAHSFFSHHPAETTAAARTRSILCPESRIYGPCLKEANALSFDLLESLAPVSPSNFEFSPYVFSIARQIKRSTSQRKTGKSAPVTRHPRRPCFAPSRIQPSRLETRTRPLPIRREQGCRIHRHEPCLHGQIRFNLWWQHNQGDVAVVGFSCCYLHSFPCKRRRFRHER